MNLKTLISIKLVLQVIAFFGIFHLFGNITDAYRTLERQNETLLEQKKYYESILKLDDKNSAAREQQYEHINWLNERLVRDDKEMSFSINTCLWILTIVLVLLANIFNRLNSKIELLKSKESEYEKNQLL